MISVFLNIGFGNFVSKDKVISVLTPESSPVKRLIKSSKSNGSLIDATCGRKVKSVIVMNTFHVILSSLETGAVVNQ